MRRRSVSDEVAGTCRDNTSRIANVNTYGIATLGIGRGMSTPQSERLRLARIKAGYASAADACRAFGWSEGTYRHHDNGTRGFGADAAKRYGRAFKVKPGYLMMMDGVDDASPNDFIADENLIVGNSVAAGVWREPLEGLPIMEIEVPPPVRNAKRMGFTVDGYSMDLHYPPGTVLDCVSIFTNGVRPETGDHVIVQRVKPDGLRELTVKEFLERGGRYFLVPRSTKPEFQAEIEVGAPDENMLEDEERVEVIAFVVSSILPQSMRVLERLGKVRRGGA